MGQTDQERELYEARRKWQLDYNTGMKVARLEGEMEGERRGEIKGEVKGKIEGKIEGEIKRIHLCERLLKRPAVTPAEQLTARSLAELTQLADSLEQELLKEP